MVVPIENFTLNSDVFGIQESTCYTADFVNNYLTSMLHSYYLWYSSFAVALITLGLCMLAYYYWKQKRIEELETKIKNLQKEIQKEKTQ